MHLSYVPDVILQSFLKLWLWKKSKHQNKQNINHGNNNSQFHNPKKKVNWTVPIIINNRYTTYVATDQKQPPEVLCKKAVLKNLGNFTGKHLRLSFFLIELQAFGWRTSTNDCSSTDEKESENSSNFIKYCYLNFW